jgi:hypothetical protein
VKHVCQHCTKEFANPGGLGAHSPFCKQNPNRVQRVRSPNAGRKKGDTPWNKGLKDDPRCARPDRKGKAYGAGLGQTEATKLRLSEVAKERGLGGYVQGSGRGKKGWYKDHFCDSSWELAYILYCEAHGLTVIRNTEKFPYQWGNKQKNYIPDFVVNDEYVEIKGYVTEEWKAKQLAFPHPLKVLTAKEIEPILAFVVDAYGKDFVKLYDCGELAERSIASVLKTEGPKGSVGSNPTFSSK